MRVKMGEGEKSNKDRKRVEYNKKSIDNNSLNKSGDVG